MFAENNSTVKLINKMKISNDSIPARTARVSYDNADNIEKTYDDDMQLTSFLFWHGHTTPFEKLVFVFEIECPLFVRSQIMRTRTASYNEVSRRYTKKNMSFFIPEYRKADKFADDFTEAEIENMYNEWKNNVLPAIINYYKKLEQLDVAKEVTRQFLPQNLMTKFHMKIDLHNLLRFLEQRTSEHAQKETRDVANMMVNILEKEIPEIMRIWTIYIDMRKLWIKDKYAIFKRMIHEDRGKKINNQ